MKNLVDCFTFYNEVELLELRFLELYDVVDKFIIVEANKTFKGDHKPFILEENKWRFTKWWDKVAHIKVIIPDNLTDAWSREKYQRNSFMTFLYSMQLSLDDIVVITDVDEIPNIDVLKYIKESFSLKGIYKLEMDSYFGSLYNKQKSVKWYHPKIMDWETLRASNPEDCRLNFNCQWWEKGGWHFTYFGGPSRISNKIDSFSHQEYNLPKFKDQNYIHQKIKNGEDLFGEWRNFEKIDPEKNTFLPKNWKLLLGNEEKYGIKIEEKLFPKNVLNLDLNNEEKYTIGWISHDSRLYHKYLGPSLERLKGKYQTLNVSDELNPAENYNRILSECKTKWLILCHEDVAFSYDLLECLDDAIEVNPEISFFGFVGADEKGTLKCKIDSYKSISTTDSCFIVIDTEKKGIRFDINNFEDFHLYVEDICVQLESKGKTILCNYKETDEYENMNKEEPGWIYHFGSTYNKLGSNWGKYNEYKSKLDKKWGRLIPTT